MQQIAMCGVQFNQIKAGLARKAYRMAEIVNDAWNFTGF
jgi:hypothetical protein